MNFEKLRKLKVDDRLKINNKIFTIVYSRPEIVGTEYYLLEEETGLEFMLQVPDKDSVEALIFYKVFRHAMDMMYREVGFQKKVEILN